MVFTTGGLLVSVIAGTNYGGRQFAIGVYSGSGFPAGGAGNLTVDSTDLAVVAPVMPLGDEIQTALTTSDVATTMTSLVDITGLSLALLAGATYEFEAVLSCHSSDSNGTQYGVQFSAAGATVEAQFFGTYSSANATKNGRIDTLHTPTGTCLGITGAMDGIILMKGIVVTTTNAGDLTIQQLKVSGGTATVYKNSFLKARRIS